MAIRTRRGSDPGKPLIAMFSRTWIIGLAVCSFAFLIALTIVALRFQDTFDRPFARPLLCFLLALFTGLFLFVLYPWEYRLKKLAWLPVTTELAGPVVLVVCFTYLLLNIIPSPEAGRFHRLLDQKEQDWHPKFRVNEVKVRFPDLADEPHYYLVSPDAKRVFGLYVVYPANTTELRMQVVPAPGYSPCIVTLNRNDTKPTCIDLGTE
jgi:hypothetical protein